MTNIDLPADFTSHHIEGYAVAAMEKGEDGKFSAPLISHIEGNLWMGGCFDKVRLPDDFRHVVSLYPWEKYALGGDTTRKEYKTYDSPDVAAVAFKWAVDDVLDHLDDGPVLVHCQAGLNRSGVVAALALVQIGPHSPQEAIDLLRKRRSPLVLCNSAFEKFVLEGGKP